MPGSLLVPAWRWVFYVNVPIGIVALVVAWAASSGWETPRRPGRLDLVGAVLFSAFLVGALGALTLLGQPRRARLGRARPGAGRRGPRRGRRRRVRGLGRPRAAGPRPVPRPAAVPPRGRSRRRRSCRCSRATGSRRRSSAAAVFVDRVLYGGPDEQRLALGALAGATAVGALSSGFIVRVLSLRLVTLAGLAASIVALVVMSGWTTATPVERRGDRAGGVRARLRGDRDAALDGGGRGGRPRGLRHGRIDRHGGADGRHGHRPRDPHRLRLDDHRPAVRPGLRHAGRLQGVHPGGAPGPAAARRPGRSRRSRRGRPARRPRSWSACSSWRRW